MKMTKQLISVTQPVGRVTDAAFSGRLKAAWLGLLLASQCVMADDAGMSRTPIWPRNAGDISNTSPGRSGRPANLPVVNAAQPADNKNYQSVSSPASDPGEGFGFGFERRQQQGAGH